MNKNPYIYNPVAKMILENSGSMIFENEKLDAIILKLIDTSLLVFQKLSFDLAPKRERNPDRLRTKLSQIANSKNVKEITSTLTDDSNYEDVKNSKYSEAKNYYTKSIKNFSDALDRIVELDKTKQDFIVQKSKIAAKNLQLTVDNIAKRAEETEQKREVKESYSFDVDDLLSEGLFTGYKRRVKTLKNTLNNLIASSEGKNLKNGYGKDWKILFTELEQRADALDNSEGETGIKSKSQLEQLEKDVEKYQNEFNSAIIKASNRTIQALEDEEELYTTFVDVKSLFDRGNEDLVRANVLYSQAAQEIQVVIHQEEEDLTKELFPLRHGDNDRDKKIKDSRLIYNIQLALCNSFPSTVGKTIKANKGPNGNFGDATKATVMTLQKMSGNKNANGEIDKTLLDNMVASDWMSRDDKTRIQKSVEKIKGKLSEGFDFYSNKIKIPYDFIKEEKIVINKSDFEAEFEKNLKEISGGNTGGKEGGNFLKDKEESVSLLAKKLRTLYNVRIEEEGFLRGDGRLKSSYDSTFIKSWIKALKEVEKKNPSEYSYFFVNGGVYPINIATTSLRTPSNWKKWSDVRGLKNLDDEDCLDFVSDYLKTWTTFGNVRPSKRYDGIQKAIESSEDLGNSSEKSLYQKMSDSIKNAEVPFINYKDLTGSIKQAIAKVSQISEESPSLDYGDFIHLNNFLVMIANTISFDGNRFISCLKWVQDNILTETVINKLSKDPDFIKLSKGEESSLDFKSLTGGIPFLTYSSSNIVCYDIAQEKREVEKKILDLQKSKFKNAEAYKLPAFKSFIANPRGILSANINYLVSSCYPSVAIHVKRMNAKAFDDLPQSEGNKCIDVN